MSKTIFVLDLQDFESIAVIAATIVALGAAVGAVLVGLWQIRISRNLAQQERVLAFHSALTTGEVGRARDRLSTYMWNYDPQSKDKAMRPYFSELLTVPSGGGAVRQHNLSTYSGNISATETPLNDLFQILWTLERVSAALSGGLINEELARSILLPHVAWWNSFCAYIQEGEIKARGALARLDEQLRKGADYDSLEWAEHDFIQRASPAGVHEN